MNKLALFSLLLCFASLSAANKDCRVWVKNSTPVALATWGKNQAIEVRCNQYNDMEGITSRQPQVIKPGENTSFATNTATNAYVARWCPNKATNSPYREVQGLV